MTLAQQVGGKISGFHYMRDASMRRWRRGVADIPLVDLSEPLSGIGYDPRLISVTAGEKRDAGNGP